MVKLKNLKFHTIFCFICTIFYFFKFSADCDANEQKQNSKVTQQQLLFLQIALLKGNIKNNVYNTIQDPASPVILVPGDGGSQIDARLNKPSGVHYICSLKSDWFDIWLNLRLLTPIEIDCFIDNMKLHYNSTTRKAMNSPGVDVRPHDFGAVDSVEYLDNARITGTDYFANIVSKIEQFNGYKRNITMFGAPYDFRLAPNQLDEFFTNLTSLIEKAHCMNSGRRVTLICHSMGCLNIVHLFNKQSQEWKDKYIRRIITIAAPWAGSVKAINAMMFGDDLGVYFFNREKLHQAQKTLPSLTYLFPSEGPIYPKDRVLVEASDKNYTIADMEQFFKDIQHPDGLMMWGDTKVYTEQLKAPGVEVWCLYSLGIPTINKLKFQGTIPGSKHEELYGDGDGTVNIESLRLCQQWSGQQREGVHVKEFQGLDHISVLRSPEIPEFIAQSILTFP